MKKTIIKIIYIIAVFILSILIISKISNTENTDMTAEMQEATFPVVTLSENGVSVNPLHGYATEMSVNKMRETILPLGSSRNVSLSVDTYGRSIDNMYFEVREIDASGLVESTDITDYSTNENTITASFQIKDLIDYDTEYMLVIVLETDGQEIRYYNRIIATEDDSSYNIAEAVYFVTNFSNMTFDDSIDSSELTSYLESSSEGDNSSYAYVNINSSYKQVTWGDLNIKEHTSPDIYIRDSHEQTSVIELQYQVVLNTDSGDKTYNVVEDYRVRYTSDRLYLLNYERTMNYIFSGDTADITGDKIELSISDSNMELVESEGGSAFAFVNEDRLFAYNSTSNKLALLFGFYDDENNDIRTTWQKNEIEILGVDEGGNVRFVVAGYMNRGEHEGYVGTAVYQYDATTNAVEELVFVPCQESPEILVSYAKELTYLSSDNTFYMIMDNDVFAVDISTKSYERVIEDIHAGDYKISETHNMVAWQGSDYTSLSLMNLSTQTSKQIDVNSGEYIRLIGFMGEDLVYGLVRESDVHNDQMGNPVYAMYCLIIEDSEGNILENYTPSGVFITSATISGNQITMSRVTWNEESQIFETANDDQIMSTLEEDEGTNILTLVASDDYENILEIDTKSDINTKSLLLQTPSLTLHEDSREVAIEQSEEDDATTYYVYGMHEMEGIYTNPANAVTTAYNAPGVVVNNQNDYVWIRGNLLTSNQIMNITYIAEDWDDMTDENSTAVCLDLILQNEDINRNVQDLLDEGNSVTDILESSLPDYDILNLEGCTMDAMLYYVNQDIPVMASLSDGNSVLIIGFNSLNTVLVDPRSGTVYKMGMNDSRAMFEESGNKFITYVK